MKKQNYHVLLMEGKHKKILMELHMSTKIRAWQIRNKICREGLKVTLSRKRLSISDITSDRILI
jgi:hypothetical protein